VLSCRAGAHGNRESAFVWRYVSAHVFTHVSTRIYTRIYTYLHTYLHVSTHISTHVSTRIYTRIYTYLHVSTRIYTRIYTYLHVSTRIYTRIYTYLHSIAVCTIHDLQYLMYVEKVLLYEDTFTIHYVPYFYNTYVAARLCVDDACLRSDGTKDKYLFKCIHVCMYREREIYIYKYIYIYIYYIHTYIYIYIHMYLYQSDKRFHVRGTLWAARSRTSI